MRLVNYWYIDKQGIDSLLSQISSEFIQEEHIKMTQKGTGSVSGNIGFAKLLKQLFNADVNLTGGVETTRTVEKVEIQPYETKIQHLKKYIEEKEVLLCNKHEVFTKYEQGKTNFVFGNVEFDTKLNVKNWEEAVGFIQQWGYIPFYNNGMNIYDERDDYFKNANAINAEIVMSLGIDKMQTSYSGFTSHFATSLRKLGGKNIPLGVFGHILKLSPDFYQINPYAIWLE